MKRRKVVAMLLAGTLTLYQPIAVFASEDFISDITSEQSGMDTEPDAIAEDTGSSDDAQEEGLPMDNSVDSAQGLINNDETETADIPQNADVSCNFDDGAGNSTTDDTNEQGIVEEASGTVDQTVIENPSCQVALSNGSLVDMEVSNDAGEIQSDYRLDVREVLGDQKKNEEDALNSTYNDNKKGSSAMFDLKVKDGQNNDALLSSPNLITLSSTDFSFLDNSVLYHKKNDGTWEQLEYTQFHDEEKNVKHITFTVNDAYGTFVFAKEAETSENNKEEVHETGPESTETTDTADTDNITTDEPASTPEKSDSNKDLNVVEQVNDFSWKGGIGGQDLSINVTSETAYPETDTLQVTEVSEDKIKAVTDVIAKAVGKNVSVDLATNINICKTDGKAELGNGVYHVDFDGVAITEDTLLYHELKDNQWGEVSYEKTGSGIEFSSSDGLGNFVFLKTEKDEAKEDKKDNSAKSSKTYSYEDDDVTITATANNDAGLPDGTELHAEKLQEGTDAYNTAMSEVEKSVKIGNNQKLFYIPYDVYFINNGEKIEPEKGKVKVKMAFKDALFGTSPKPDETFVAHIKDDGTVEQITNSSKEKDTVVFGVDSFSIMGPAIVTEADNTGSEGKDSVTPVIIDKFNASFVSGATLTDGKYVWNPSDSASGHMFVYRIDYTMSGTFSTDKGAFKIEVPLHILKDRDGNWADTFDCPYSLESELSSDDNPDFVYSVDEENNKAIIYNYKPYPTGEAGYIEVSYSTSKNTMNYVDMGGSTEVHAKVYATNDASTVTAEADAVPVYIDTHATISYTQKKAPTLYSKWNDSWGEKPEGADNYLYLVWPIRTYINKNTSMYNFYLDDTFSSLEGSVVGYRFAGQDKYTETNHVDNVSSYGDRYDYVLTRHSKSLAEEKVQSDLRYEVHNDVVATVDPIDQVDEDTIARSSLDWWYEAPKYEAPTGHFWAEKEGIYGKRNVVMSSEDVSDYTLAEFCAGDENTIDNLKYHTYGNAYPYPWTLADGATGTVDDATNGLYGTKKVNYQFTDDTFYLEGTRLNNEDYELTNIEWTPTVNDATFNPNSYTFVEAPITNYSDEDNITIWVRGNDDSWKQAATYNLQRKDYENVDDTLIKSTAGGNVAFTKGVKGVRFTASNAYYHTKFELYPIVSLNRTDNVLAIIGTDKSKVRLRNEVNFIVTQNTDILFGRTVDGTDYIQKVKRESKIKKDIIQTKNVKRKSSFDITWRVDFGEKYVDNNGVHYILQESGKFYDLLPAGSILDTSSITVNASGEGLGLGEYTYETIDNFKNSGRTMLVVSINNETNSRYIMTYKTSHTYDSINDYGKNVLNSVAYESGNEKIGEGLPDNGGEITDKSYMTDLDEKTDSDKFKYAEARYNINILFAASTGLKKQIKNSTSTQYSYDTTVHLDEDYSYQVRLVNDASTKSKDIVFFDSLENFYQKAEETSPTKVSDWKGTLTGINVNNMLFKNISPDVYLSKIDSMNIQNHHDLSETADGDAVWLPYDEFVQKYGIDKATAIAIDASRCVDGSDYIMNEKESISFDIYMKAPGENKSGKTDPIAYNNIYVERTAMVVNDGGETEEVSQFYHQDYTKAYYRVSGDLRLKKVDETDMKTPIGAIELTKKVKGKSGAEKYAHTPNVNDDGVQNGNYANNLNLNDVVSIPGSTQLHVVLKYAGESVSYDYVCAWTGNHPEYTASGNYSSAISVNGTQKFGGGSGTTVEFDVEGDTVTFGYKSDSSGCGNGFGYYAVVTGNAGLGDKQYFKFNVKLSSDNADLTKLISGEKMYGDTVFKDGEGLVYLGGGDKAVIDGIPAGVNYTITEEPNEDYNVSWTGTAGSGNENTYSGAVEANVTHEIMCTNTYAKSTGGGSSTEHPAEYGVLKLTKQFVNITGDKNATLHIAFWNLDKNLSYKYSDGTSEKEFTSDATGMADVTLSVTDNQEFTFSDLPAGCKYQISEEAGDYISSYDVSGATQIAQQHGENFDVNKALTTAKETINKNDVAVVAFTNTGKETPKDEDKLVNVHVEKTWNDNDNAAGMRPDSITVQLTQDGDVVATATLDADTKWQADFTDLDKYAEDGTTECDYEVNEIDVPGYKSEIKTVSEDKTKSFTITNSIEDVGDLKVTKTVKGDVADLTQDFRFTVALEKDGKPLAGTFNLDGNKGTKTGTVALDEDGTASFTLKHGESIYMKDILAGVKWTVTEIVQSGYTEANNGKYSGSITKGKASTADVVNTYNPSHKVTVKKTVKGNQGDKTKQFKFQMSITGNGVPGNLAYAKNGKAGSVAVKNGIAEFTLGHKDVIVFKEVPEGVEYAVTELDGESNGYTVESKNASGTLNKDTEISFVNTKDVGVPTAAMTNTGAIAGVVMTGMIGIMAIVVLKRKKSEK